MKGRVIHQWNADVNVNVDVDVDVDVDAGNDGDGNIDDNGDSMGMVW